MKPPSQIRCSVSISCFKDLVEENYLFSPTSSSSFSALSFFTRNTLAISSVFVVLYLYFNFIVSCESLDSENKQANKQTIKNNTLKEKKKMVLVCCVVKRQSPYFSNSFDLG